MKCKQELLVKEDHSHVGGEAVSKLPGTIVQLVLLLKSLLQITSSSSFSESLQPKNSFILIHTTHNSCITHNTQLMHKHTYT